MGKKPTGGTSDDPRPTPPDDTHTVARAAAADERYIALVGEPYTSYGLPDGGSVSSGADGVVYVPRQDAEAVAEQHGLTERDGESMTAEEVAAEQSGTAPPAAPEADDPLARDRSSGTRQEGHR
jgi:hypothetical protein